MPQDPQSNTDSRKRLYDAVSQKLDIGTFEDFSRKMDDSASRKRFYDAVSKQFDIGDFPTFEGKIGGKTVPASKPAFDLGAPGRTLQTATQQLGRGEYLAGGANVANALLGSAFLPFAAAEQAVRQIPTVGEPIANAATLPFQLVGRGVRAGENLIGKGLSALGIPDPQNPASEAVSGLNQQLAQLFIPALAGKVKTAPEFARTPAPAGLKTAGELQKTIEPQAAAEVGIPPAFRQEMVKKLGAETETRFGKVKSLSDADLTRVYQERGLDQPAPISEAPVSQGGSMEVRGPANEAQIAQSDPVAKVISAIKEAKPIREQTERLYHIERTKRAGELAKVYSTPGGEATLPRALSTQKGELPKATFSPIRDKVTQADVDALHNKVIGSDLSVYERLSAQVALDKLFTKEGGAVPTKGELSLLEDVFGTSFVDAIKTKMSHWERFKSLAVDLANVPRTVMAAFDMSMPFRQAAVQVFSHPIKTLPAWRDMHKAFFSEESYRATKEEIANKPNAPLYKTFRLDILDPDKQHGPLTQREESFTSHLAERIPFIGKGVRLSERAAYTFTNKVRSDMFDMYAEELKKAGITPEKNPEYYRSLADWVNVSTGRGSFGSFTRYAPTASALMFSPRLLASRFQALTEPLRYQSVPKEIRVMAMKDMIKFASAWTGMLTLAKAGGAQVTVDPRSSDFGKIRIGNTRIDAGAGFGQILRFFAQITSGQRKNTEGKVIEMTGKDPFAGSRLETIYRFGESKLNPHIGFLVDWLRGKNFAGEPFDLSDEAISHLAPLYLQDAYDAMKDKQFTKGLFISLPGFYGMGVQTYKPKPKGTFAPVARDLTRATSR